MTADLVAERQAIALAVSGHPALGQRFLALPVEAFTHEVHKIVGSVIRDRLTRGIPVQPDTIAIAAAAQAGTDHQAEQVRRFVLNAATSAPPADSWDYYAELLVTFAAARRGLQVGQRLVQQLDTVTEPHDIAQALTTAQAHLDDVTAGLVTTATTPPLSLHDLLTEPVEPFDWLVPGLWERTDRLMITGYEGTGKSFLLAQFALTVAAGLHPFTAEPFRKDGCRVVVIDCENSKRQLRRRYERIVQIVNHQRETRALPPIDWSQHLRFVIRPDGINLGDPRECARIEQAIALSAPDLVVAGPLYRMHKANINDEQAARELVDALDRLRIRYQFMLITEAHVGHVGETTTGRKLRPTGSSLFLRWPEFGFGLRPFGPGLDQQHPSMVQLTAWRGARDERHWPDLLRHSDFLPWMPHNLDKYLADAPLDLQSTPRLRSA